jgi:cell division protein FtsQ
MSPRWKKAGLIFADLLIAVYIIAAFAAFNKPEPNRQKCKDVNIVVADAATHGFIDAKEVKSRLEKLKLYPKGKTLDKVSCRKIEETLLATPFVKTAECYKDVAGTVNVSITQRMPVVRIKAVNNDDYYIDDKDCIMPNSNYTSDLMIATGYISRSFATLYVSPMARKLMADDFCKNLFQQINVTGDLGIELIPRIGDNVVYLGHVPVSKNKTERIKLVDEFVEKKMKRLKAFYKYGLPVAGWNKYSEISLEFDNQIICKRSDAEASDK